MALIRGAQSGFPCPVCLVPKDEMCKGRVYPCRTTKTMREVYNDAMEQETVKKQEDHLKSAGLRGIEVGRMLTCLGICTYTIHHRMYFGDLRIQIHIWPYHLTVCMHHILVCSRTIYGQP